MKKKIYLFCIIVLSMLILLSTSTAFALKNNEVNDHQSQVLDIQTKILKAKEETERLEREKNRLHLILEKEKTNKVPVLRYHNIYKEEDKDLIHNKIGSYNISEKEFKKQMKYLKDNNYYTATLDELNSFINNEIELPKNTVVITFDDGYESLKTIAYPILKENNFNASTFIIGKNAQRYNNQNFKNRINYLGYDDIKDISDLVEIQSHSFGLHSLDNKESLYKTSTKKAIDKDFKKMSETLDINYFAYPYNGDEELHHEILEENNIKLAFCNNEGVVKNNTNKYKIPRITVSNNLKFEDFIEKVK